MKSDIMVHANMIGVLLLSVIMLNVASPFFFTLRVFQLCRR